MTVMNRNRKYLGVFSAVGLIAVLGITRGLDASMAFVRRPNAEPLLSPFLFLWGQTLITLLLATLLLLLFWFMLDRAPRNVWIAALYLLTGLFIVASPEIYFTPALSWLIPQFMIASVVSFRSYMLFAGGFVAIMGLFILILPSRERMASP
jgi:hypothetical protein